MNTFKSAFCRRSALFSSDHDSSARAAPAVIPAAECWAAVGAFTRVRAPHRAAGFRWAWAKDAFACFHSIAAIRSLCFQLSDMDGRVFTKRTRRAQREYEEELEAFEYKPLLPPPPRIRRTGPPPTVTIDEEGEREGAPEPPPPVHEPADDPVRNDAPERQFPRLPVAEERADANEQQGPAVQVKEEPQVKQELADHDPTAQSKRKKRKKRAAANEVVQQVKQEPR